MIRYFLNKTLYKAVELVKVFSPNKYSLVLRICGSLRSLFYIGNQKICPCCNGHFRKFLSFRERENAQCPRCYSLERHRLVWLYLKNKTNIFYNNLKILHFAPEYSLQKNLKSMPNLEYVSADLSSPLAMLNMDIANIIYNDNSFDVVLCIYVLTLILNDQKAMKELFRILKPGGWAIIQTPVKPQRDKTAEPEFISLASTKRKEHKFIFSQRIYGNDYKDRLEKAGFAVKKDNYINDLCVDTRKKYGLTENEEIYFCTKQK